MDKRIEKKGSVKKNISWVAISNIIYAICQWVTLIIIARLGNVSEVGIYSFALAISAPIIQFFSLNLRVAIATDQNNKFSFQEYETLRYWLTFLSLGILSLISVFTQDNSKTLFIVIVVSLGKGVESIIDIYLGLFQKKEKHNIISQIVIFKGFSLVICFLFGYILKGSLFYSSLFTLTLWFLLLLFIKKQTYKIPDIKSDKKQKRYASLVLLTLPLSFAILFDSLTINSARYLIEYKLGLEQLGYFSSVAYFMVAGGTIVGAIGHVITPKLALLYNEENLKQYIKLGITSISAGILVGILGVVISFLMGDKILSLFYGKGYEEYQSLFIVIMLAATLWHGAGMAGCLINASRVFKYQTFSNFFSFIVSFLAIILFIDQGVVGVAWGIVIGMGLRFILTLLLVIKIIFKKRKKNR